MLPSIRRAVVVCSLLVPIVAAADPVEPDRGASGPNQAITIATPPSSRTRELSLPAAPPGASVAPVVAGAPDGSALDAAGAASVASAPDPVVDSFERRPLGRPAGLFTVGADPAGSASSASVEPESAGLLASLDPRTNGIARVVASLLVVLALLALLFLGMRVLGNRVGLPGRPSGVLETLARYPTGRGQSLVLLKLGRRIVLVHQAGATMSTLTEVTDPDEVASLLSRVEAGGRGRRGSSEPFDAALRRASDDGPSRVRRAASNGGIETVDLTRTQSRGLSLLAAARRGTA